MAVRKVAVLGHPVLRKVAEPVPEADIKSEKIKTLIKDMIETMAEYDGRGLAAPQIHESIQVLVMLWDFDPKIEPKIMCLINPELKDLTQETSSYWEGCLSLPGLRGLVSRPNKVLVQALNEKGEKIKFIAEGFAATVVQHEYDHLLGRVYIDRMTDMSNLSFNREFEKYLASPENEEGDEDGDEFEDEDLADDVSVD
jgi:peptide deformylase